jgi:hypothetical protein
MLIKTFFCLCLYSGTLLITAAHAVDEIAGNNELRQAIQTAKNQQDSPFTLDVRCTDAQVRRVLQVYSAGVGVWNRHTQISLPWPLRSRLLGLLLDYDFPAFSDRYGEKAKSGKMEGPLRVSCEINFAIGSLQKSSAQLSDGPQSANFTDLAKALLNEAEPLAGKGLTIKNLTDGLDKLASGILASQVFSLRYVEIPSPGSALDGVIVRIGDGQLTRQVYTPGRVMGEPISDKLTVGQFHTLVETLQAVGFSDLPINLYALNQIELEVQVLGQRKTIIARPFSRLKTERTNKGQQGFNDLAVMLRQIKVEDEN